MGDGNLDVRHREKKEINLLVQNVYASI